MQIEYSKNSVKYINAADKPTKKRLKEAIEKIPFGDLGVLFSIEDDIIYILTILFQEDRHIGIGDKI